MEFKFKEVTVDDDMVYSEDPYYDLVCGGYINPEELLTDQTQADAVNAAIRLIESFLVQAEWAGVLEIT